MQDKNKTAIIVMVVISLFIAALGFICGVLVYSQLTAQIAANGSGELIVEGYDIAGLINSAGQAGALVLSVMIVAASLVAILLQWLGYALVKLIKGVYKNQQGNNTHNNIE